MLFLIFINDIVDEIQCNIRLFADDTSLYIVVKDAYEAAIKLNTDTEKIYEWSTRWQVNFNPKKSKAMTISKKSNKPHHPPVYMNGTIIKEVESHKHLGLFFHENGNWHVHVNHIIDKVTPRLNVFRTLQFKLQRNHLQVICFSFIRPLLEYANIIWDNIPEYLRVKLESIQI